MLSTPLASRPQGKEVYRTSHRSNGSARPHTAQPKQLLLQMVQSQLDDSTEFGDLLELQEQIRALQTELAEVKQADDEELDKLLDQNAELQISTAGAHYAQEQAVQAVKVAGQKIAQLETANAELRVSNRQLGKQAEEGSTQHAKELKAAKQEAEAAQHSETATQAALKKLQILHEQTASKLPLAEMQLVELRAQRLEGLQAADTVKQQATQLASSKSQAKIALAAQKASEQTSAEHQARTVKLEFSLTAAQAKAQQDKEHLQSQEEQLNRQMQELQAAKQEVQGLQQSLQAAQQEVQAAQSAQQAGEASHHVELDQLQQDLVLSQQQLADELSKRQRANPCGSSRAASHGPSEDVLPARPQAGHEEPGLSALALVPAQQTTGQGAEQTGLLEEVAALRGLLARVVPQLEDLAGVKQQMAQLLSVLLPGTGISSAMQLPGTALAAVLQLLHTQAQPAGTTSSAEPASLSPIAQMASAPDPFAALRTAEPPPFPGPMFTGLNAIINPFHIIPNSAPTQSAAVAAVAPLAGASAQTMKAAVHSAPSGSKPTGAATAGPGHSPMPPPLSGGLPGSVACNASEQLPKPVEQTSRDVPSLSNQAAADAAQAHAAVNACTHAQLSGHSTQAPVASTAGDAASKAVMTSGLDADTAAEAAIAAAPVVAASIGLNVPTQPVATLPRADMLAVKTNRNVTKRKWDAMTRDDPAAPAASSGTQAPAASSGTQAPAASSGTQAPAASVATTPPTGFAVSKAPSGCAAAAAPAVSAAAVAPDISAATTVPAISAPVAAKMAVTPMIGAATTRSLAPPTLPVPTLQTLVTGGMSTGSPQSAALSGPAAPSPLQMLCASKALSAQVQPISVPSSLPVPEAVQLNSLPATLSAPELPALTSETQQPLLARASQLQPAVKAGKELASKLAADFAQQHRSSESLAAKKAPATAVPPQQAVSLDIKEAIAAAEKLIHDQALKATQSVQGGEESHAARMEAIRLRNMARHDVPQPVTLPPPPSHPSPAPVAPLNPVQAPPGAEIATQSQEATGIFAPAEGKRSQSRKRRRARRSSNQEASWVSEAVPEVPGAPAEFVARGSIGGLHSDSPASNDSRGTVRKQIQSLDRHQATKKKQSASPGRHSSKGAKWRSPRGRGRQSPRGRHAASTRRGDSPEPSGKPVHRDSGRASQNGPGKAAERHSDTRLQRQHSSGDRYSPIRRSSSAGRSAKQARLSRTPPQGSSASEHLQEQGRRAGSRDAVHKQPAQRSLSLLGPRPSAAPDSSTPAAEFSKPAARSAGLASKPYDAFVSGGSLRVDSPRGGVQPNQAAAMVAVGAADEEAVEEAEEGELEPGERAASPEEEEMSAAEASNPQASRDSKEKGPAASGRVDVQASGQMALPAGQASPRRADTASPRAPDLLPTPQSGYNSGGTPALAVDHLDKAGKPSKAISGGSQSTVSQRSATQETLNGPGTGSHRPSKRSKLSNVPAVPAKTTVDVLMPNGTKQPTQSSNSSGRSKAAHKAAAAAAKPLTHHGAIAGNGAMLNLVSSNAPDPPPGSPTASSKTQEMVPPPPPAVTPPAASQQSPPPLRTQPAVISNHATQAIVQSTSSVFKPAAQQTQQHVLPGVIQPWQSAAVITPGARGVQSHRSFMEQQRPPQVQAPAAMLPRNHVVQQQGVLPDTQRAHHDRMAHQQGFSQGLQALQQHVQPQQIPVMLQQQGHPAHMHQRASGDGQAQHEQFMHGQAQGQLQAAHQAPFHFGHPLQMQAQSAQLHPWQAQQAAMQQQGGGMQQNNESPWGLQQQPQRQLGLPPTFVGQRGPSPGPGPGVSMQGQNADRQQQMLHLQGLQTNNPGMHVQAMFMQNAGQLGQIAVQAQDASVQQFPSGMQPPWLPPNFS